MELDLVWVLLLVWLEFTHGVLDDIFLLARAYEASGYIAFIVIHLIIIVTGFIFAREVTAVSTTAGLGMAA